jgi:hypothetical protein
MVQVYFKGNQQYCDGKLKFLPVVLGGPWIVKKAVGPGTSPAMIGRDLPIQYCTSLSPHGIEKGCMKLTFLSRHHKLRDKCADQNLCMRMVAITILVRYDIPFWSLRAQQIPQFTKK